MSFLCAPRSTHPGTATHLIFLLEEAQLHERQLWAVLPTGNSDQLAWVEAADEAWTRVRSEAEALVAQVRPETHTREMRLAAALLIAVLDATEPQQVGRLQDLARQLFDDVGRGRTSQPDPVVELLQLITYGPFVMTGAGHRSVALEEDGSGVALTI